MNKFLLAIISLACLCACNRSPEYYFKRANESLIKGKELQAIQYYNKAILLKRNYPEALTARGMLYERHGDKQKAMLDYKKAANLNSNYIPAYNNLAGLLMDQGKYKEAVEYLNKALDINRDYVYAVLNRGLAYYKLGKCKAAKADLSKAIRMNPKFDTAYYHRALCLKQEGNISAALKDLDLAIENNPSAAIAWNERGKIRYSMKEYPYAAQDFQKADELAPQDMRADTAFWLALAAYQVGYYEKALDSALKAEELRPQSYQVMGLIADIYAKNGDVNNAEDYYKKAEKLAGNKAAFYRARLAALRK